MSIWTWISSIISFLVGMALFIIVIYATYTAIDSGPFTPLEVYPIIIDTPVVEAGGMLVARDGFCNKEPNHPRIVELYAFLQATSIDENRSDGVSPTIDVVGTNSEPVTYTLFVCLGTEPVAIPIPETLEPNFYTLTIRVITKGRAGQIQNEVRTSEVFEVVPAAVD